MLTQMGAEPRAPLCPIDVDGVVNCLPDDPSNREVPVFEAEVLEIRVLAGTRDRLAQLASNIEMVRATSWESDAHLHLFAALDVDEEQ
jgi:hypothetical protein